MEQLDSYSAVALAIASDGPISRADLARRLNLSASSLTRLVRTWEDAGFARQVSHGCSDSGLGRPTLLLDVDPGFGAFVGIIVREQEAIAVTIDATGAVRTHHHAQLSDKNLNYVTSVITDLFHRCHEAAATANLPVLALGVSLGGQVEDGSMVVRAPFLQWRHVDLRAYLSATIPVPVVVVNDLEAVTFYELLKGAGRHSDDFALLTLGAGIGQGVVHSRSMVVTDALGVGPLGHLHLADGWGYCQRGHRSCIGSTLTTDGLLGAIHAALPPTQRERTAITDLEAVIHYYENHHPLVRAIVTDYIRLAGEVISALAAMTMTSAVTVGGEASAVLRLDLPTLEAAAAVYRSPNLERIKIRLAPSTFIHWAQGAALVGLRNQIVNYQH